jgi:hypothetical protein
MQNNIVKKIVNIFNVIFGEIFGGMPKSMALFGPKSWQTWQ